MRDAEWKDVKGKVDGLDTWKKRVTGGLSVMSFMFSLVLGLLVYLGTRMVDQNENMDKTIDEMNINLAVFHKEVEPFIAAGPRFTARDYELRSQAGFSSLREWVTHELKAYPPPWIKDQMDAQERRLDTIERKMDREHP